MRILSWAGPAVGVLFLGGVGFLLWSVYGSWPVPDGYHFPRHSIWGGGPAALFEGELIEVDGCIRTSGDEPSSVVWPPGYSLTIEDGQPVVHGILSRGRMGEAVRMGGGWYQGVPPTGRDVGGCPPPFFLTTGFVRD